MRCLLAGYTEMNYSGFWNSVSLPVFFLLFATGIMHFATFPNFKNSLVIDLSSKYQNYGYSNCKSQGERLQHLEKRI